MAGAVLEVQWDSNEVRFFLHKLLQPVLNRDVEFPFQNLGHGLLSCCGGRGAIATFLQKYCFRHRDLRLCTLSIPLCRPQDCLIRGYLCLNR